MLFLLKCDIIQNTLFLCEVNTMDVVKEKGVTKSIVISSTTRIGTKAIPCALKGFPVCPNHACDGYDRRCDFWRHHSGK